MEEHRVAAKRELSKLNPTKPAEREAMKKAAASLDEGLKEVACRQKHIRIADRSELDWQVVAAYESDNLAFDSNDKKNAVQGGEGS